MKLAYWQGFARFQVLKIARQDFTSSDIAAENSQNIYLPNCFSFSKPGPQQITSSSIKDISSTKPDKPAIS